MPTTTKVYSLLIRHNGFPATICAKASVADGYVSVTGKISYNEVRHGVLLVSWGAIHDEIRKHFGANHPAVKLIPFHLVDVTEGPMHYIANTLYWVRGAAGIKQGWWDKDQWPPPVDCLAAARRAACWPDATDDDLRLDGLEDRLRARLPGILSACADAVAGAGLSLPAPNNQG